MMTIAKMMDARSVSRPIRRAMLSAAHLRWAPVTVRAGFCRRTAAGDLGQDQAQAQAGAGNHQAARGTVRDYERLAAHHATMIHWASCASAELRRADNDYVNCMRITETPGHRICLPILEKLFAANSDTRDA
jgi:hypothetical protein